jgi:hypothetical protein
MRDLVMRPGVRSIVKMYLSSGVPDLLRDDREA